MRVTGVDGVKSLVGRELGPSDWEEITQERVNLFADATGDHQWIHVDPQRAAAGPYHGTIAHGYLTLSLIPYLMPKILQVEGFSAGINYGCDRVRFPAPVPVGSKVRCRATVDEVTDVPGGVQVKNTVTIEVEGQTKPSCVATTLVRYLL
ncbi:MAG: MaoC family dehydratase [Micromonosporaceae bacterium]|jgi:acyl dehydratase|nr:MaoC family dehydratase [Micromonosporaceae bacterium]